MVITGKIFKIVVVSEDKAYLIMRRRDGRRNIMVAYDLFGHYKRLALEELKLQPRDKIRANMVLESREYNGRWYTDAKLRHIDVLERAPKSLKDIAPTLGFVLDTDIDKDTGEVYED